MFCTAEAAEDKNTIELKDMSCYTSSKIVKAVQDLRDCEEKLEDISQLFKFPPLNSHCAQTVHAIQKSAQTFKNDFTERYKIALFQVAEELLTKYIGSAHEQDILCSWLALPDIPFRRACATTRVEEVGFKLFLQADKVACEPYTLSLAQWKVAVLHNWAFKKKFNRANNYQEQMHFLQQQYPELLKKDLEILEKDGTKSSFIFLGNLYTHGIFVPKDSDKGRRYIQKSRKLTDKSSLEKNSLSLPSSGFKCSSCLNMGLK